VICGRLGRRTGIEYRLVPMVVRLARMLLGPQRDPGCPCRLVRAEPWYEQGEGRPGIRTLRWQGLGRPTGATCRDLNCPRAVLAGALLASTRPASWADAEVPSHPVLAHPGCGGASGEQSREHPGFRSRLVADASGAPVLRDQGPIGRPGTARPIQASSGTVGDLSVWSSISAPGRCA
jgi:hypothetical protein